MKTALTGLWIIILMHVIPKIQIKIYYQLNKMSSICNKNKTIQKTKKRIRKAKL
jgi:hypothetical protein